MQHTGISQGRHHQASLTSVAAQITMLESQLSADPANKSFQTQLDAARSRQQLVCNNQQLTEALQQVRGMDT